MFRRTLSGLPKDPVFPKTLTELGYFITERGEIRKLSKPDEYFQYFITNNDRYNQMHREAMNRIVRGNIMWFMSCVGVAPLYLPQLTTSEPSEPHLPILCHPAEILRMRRRVIIVVNENNQDLGIWAYRMIGNSAGMGEGSMVEFARELRKRSLDLDKNADVWDPAFNYTSEIPLGEGASSATQRAIEYHYKYEQIQDQRKAAGLIVLNTSQHLYSHRYNEAMSHTTWNSLPRESAVHPPVRKDEVENAVPENSNTDEHIKFVFERIIDNPNFVARDAELYILAISDGSESLLDYLNHNWGRYARRIAAMALIQPIHLFEAITDPGLAYFLKHRARAWVVSQAPFDTLLSAPGHPGFSDQSSFSSEEHLINDPFHISTLSVSCPTLSSGVWPHVECIVPTIYKRLLDFFDEVAVNARGYCNPEHIILGADEVPELEFSVLSMSLESNEGAEAERERGGSVEGGPNQGTSEENRNRIEEIETSPTGTRENEPNGGIDNSNEVQQGENEPNGTIDNTNEVQQRESEPDGAVENTNGAEQRGNEAEGTEDGEGNRTSEPTGNNTAITGVATTDLQMEYIAPEA